MGQLKRAFLHLAPSGGSAGVADIVFNNPHDAERALASYNNVELDGKPFFLNFFFRVEFTYSIWGYTLSINEG